MNIHHLELFHYVAKHRGIVHAVRNMPYGIQQPAVSGQLLKLEKVLGIKLFHRRPFALTSAGQELAQFINPFFNNLGHLEEKLRKGDGHRLRIAASSMILRDHFPVLLQKMQHEFPKLNLTLYELNQPQSEVLIQNQEIDLAFSALEKEPLTGIRSCALIQLPMTLILKKNPAFNFIKDFSSKACAFPLVSLPAGNLVAKKFQGELKKRNIHWSPAIEVGSFDLIRSYVSKGFGIGLSIHVPKMPRSIHIREIPLRGFPQLQINAFWQGELSQLSKCFLELVKEKAKQIA